jgi:hypothetical protein
LAALVLVPLEAAVDPVDVVGKGSRPRASHGSGILLARCVGRDLREPTRARRAGPRDLLVFAWIVVGSDAQATVNGNRRAVDMGHPRVSAVHRITRERPSV